MIESLIGSKEYPGFIYAVCDDDDPEYWRKVYAVTRWRENLKRPEVIKVEMKDMSQPFYVLTMDNALPLAYNSTRLEISTVLSKCSVQRFFEYTDGKWGEYKVGIGDVIGLKTIKFKRIPGTYKYVLDIPANRTSKMRGWLIYFISDIPVYPPRRE
ncbi:MAG: hypothetical protein K2F87_00925 [Muribaculaceae bacterium]|nr:hypothetical protein [Muribaculaceae bacterium]